MYKRNRSIYSIPCTVKNLLEIDPLRKAILCKSQLHKHIDSTAPTVDWDKFQYQEGVYIVKIDRPHASGGNSNYIVTSIEEWNSRKQMLLELSREARTRSYNPNRMNGAVVSNYISNPLLSEGKKCHFRLYLMVRSWDVPVLSPFAIVMTAELPYTNQNYENKKIHDSHLTTTDKIEFVKDERILEAIREACLPLINAIKGYRVEAYKESNRGYQILAPDVILDEDYNAFILEVNCTPGQGDLTKPGIVEYEALFSEWEFQHGIRPCL
jgi:hypothetical protein